MDVTQRVQAFYNTYPYPPEPLLDMPPLGWNWRWSWQVVHSLYYGYRPEQMAIQILDAGCGTGFGSQYLGYQNPQAQILAVDLSDVALEVGRERCQRAGVSNVTFEQGSLLEVCAGTYDFINCVGVLHHLADPSAGLRVLREQLTPGGMMHLFLYSAQGRREIALMQEALRLLAPRDVTEGVALGRQLFKTLPADNPLVRFEREHWAMDNKEDSSFADMYLQVQETCYTVHSLFDLIEQAGMTFLGFSNPEFWQIERLLSGDLLARAMALPERDRYRLVELLDPTANHYELFVARIPLTSWQPTDAELLQTTPHRCPYIGYWPNEKVINYNYQPVTLTPPQVQWLQACDGVQTVAELNLLPLNEVRALARDLLVLLAR